MIQNTILESGEKYEVPKSCFSGYIKNSNSVSVDIYITGNSASNYKETLAPNTVLHLRNAEYDKIINLSDAYSIDIVYCSANEQIEFLNGQVQIGNASVTIDGNVQVSSGTLDVGTLNSITEISAGAIRTTGNTNNGLTATLTTGNTAQQFTTTSTAVQHFQLRNTSGETIYIGNSTVQATLLFPNSMIIWDAMLTETTDLSSWYFVGATAGDSISVNYQV